MKHSTGFTFNMFVCYCEDYISACVESDTFHDHMVPEAGSLFHILLTLVGPAAPAHSTEDGLQPGKSVLALLLLTKCIYMETHTHN